MLRRHIERVTQPVEGRHVLQQQLELTPTNPAATIIIGSLVSTSKTAETNVSLLNLDAFFGSVVLAGSSCWFLVSLLEFLGVITFELQSFSF